MAQPKVTNLAMQYPSATTAQESPLVYNTLTAMAAMPVLLLKFCEPAGKCYIRANISFTRSKKIEIRLVVGPLAIKYDRVISLSPS